MSEVLFYAEFIVPNHSSKKNGKQISFNKKTGRNFIRSNDKVLNAQSVILNKLNKLKADTSFKTITDDVIAEFVFWFPENVFYTKKGLRSKTLNDLSNLYEQAQDCLQRAGIIENDTQIVNHGNSHRRPTKGDQFWLEIKLIKPTECYFAKLIS
jgi:Holliday junction resolvase RusA-like endonuclease